MFTNARVLEETRFQFRDSDLQTGLCSSRGKVLAIRRCRPFPPAPSGQGLPEILGGQDAAEEGAGYTPPEGRLRLVPSSSRRPPPLPCT